MKSGNRGFPVNPSLESGRRIDEREICRRFHGSRPMPARIFPVRSIFSLAFRCGRGYYRRPSLSISVAIGEIIDVFLSQESTYRSIDRKSPLNCSSSRVLISVYYRKIKKEKPEKRREGKR